MNSLKGGFILKERITEEEKIRLIKEREKRGWSQTFVAQIAGCSREYYNRLENKKKNNPRAIVVKNLAHLFAVSADDILKWMNV